MDPSQDPERRRRTSPTIVQALHSLKEDATFAHKQAMAGDLTALVPLQRAWKVLEAAVMAADRK